MWLSHSYKFLRTSNKPKQSSQSQERESSFQFIQTSGGYKAKLKWSEWPPSGQQRVLSYSCLQTSQLEEQGLGGYVSSSREEHLPGTLSIAWLISLRFQQFFNSILQFYKVKAQQLPSFKFLFHLRCLWSHPEWTAINTSLSEPYFSCMVIWHFGFQIHADL